MLKLKKKNYIISLVIVFLLGAGICAGGLYLYLGVFSDSTIVNSKDYKALDSFATKYQELYELDYHLTQDYLWDYDDDSIREKMYKLMVDELGDKYSTYMNKEEFKKWNEDLSGKFSGIGLTFTQTDGKFIVVETVKDTPAEEAGFKAGDVILKVNGKSYKTMEGLQGAIRGDEGTKVVITYSRDGATREAKITRQEIVINTVDSQIIDKKYGYIRISAFDQNTSAQFKTELKEMESKNVKGLVIDLRQNGGGYVDESLNVADMLLPSCNITSMKDKNGIKEKYNSDASYTKLKYVLLVDGGTASASEILAGAVQDNKGGAIVGVKTYGKGIVQSTYNLSQGSGLKLTTMEYVTPNGNRVHKKGITPDYAVKLKAHDNTDYQLEKAITLLSK